MINLLISDASVSTCEQLKEHCENLTDIRLIKCVHNGEDAINEILSTHVDVLLMDIIMPVLDGFGLLTRLNAIDANKRPSVFVHTAFPGEKLLSHLRELGVTYCFVKPMKPEIIVQRILQFTYPASAEQVQQRIKLIMHNNDIDNIITSNIRAVGVPAHLTGYHYLRDAIRLSAQSDDPSSISLTKYIYPQVAKLYNKRPELIERSIRNAIETAWIRGNMDILNEYFGYTIDDNKGKPTNSEFIAMIADRVRIAMKPD